VTAKPTAADPRFEAIPGIDITKLPLSPEEGFVVSRLLDRRMSIADLARETGLPLVACKTHVESLVRKGAVRPVGTTESSGPVKRVKDPYAGIIFSPADLADGKDLTEEQKKRILLLEMHLDDWNHYRLLDVKRSASGADIKTGYFKASKEFHPDTYFRKDLGKYADRVDRVFRAMKAAYDVLSRPISRSAYDETLVGELSEDELEELSQIADVKRREQEHAARLLRNEAARKASRLKWNPLAQRLNKARELFRLAEDARKGGRIDEAATHARLACTYDEALKVRAEPILAEADVHRVTVTIKRVNAAMQYGDKSMEAEIKRVAEEAAVVAEQTRRPTLLVEVAAVLLKVGLPQRAFRLASMATEGDEKLVAGWRIVAQAAAAEGKWALTARAAERWLALEPTSAEAKAMVKSAKEGRGGGKV
jgi:hypothetical protein